MYDQHKSETHNHVSAPGLHELVRGGLPRSACGKNPPWSGPLGKKATQPNGPLGYATQQQFQSLFTQLEAKAACTSAL